MKRITRHVLDYLRHSEGASALEFALIFPVLALLIMGILEFSLILYASSLLQGSTVTAARQGRTGFPDPASESAREAAVFATIKNGVVPLLDGSKLQIAAKSFANYSAITPLPTTPCTNDSALVTGSLPLCDHDVGGSGSVVEYSVGYSWNILTPLMSAIIGSGGVMNLRANALVRNEPFAGGTFPIFDKTPVTTVTVVPAANGTSIGVTGYGGGGGCFSGCGTLN